MPMAIAAIIAVTGLNEMPVSAMSPNTHSTTSTTGRIVITPRNGRRADAKKVRTSKAMAASREIAIDCTCESCRASTTPTEMMFSFVGVAVTPAMPDTGAKAPARPTASSRAPASPA